MSDDGHRLAGAEPKENTGDIADTLDGEETITVVVEYANNIRTYQLVRDYHIERGLLQLIHTAEHEASNTYIPLEVAQSIQSKNE